MSCAVSAAEPFPRQHRPTGDGGRENTARQMRKLGLVLCIGSAAVTLAAAVYLAVIL